MRILGLWTVLSVGSSLQVYFAHHRAGAIPLTWLESLRDGFAFWYLWAIAAPAVVWLGRRFQVDRANFSRHFFIHLGASLDIAFVQIIALVLLQRPASFATTLVDDFTLLFHWNVVIYWATLAIVHAYDYHRMAEQRAAERAELERALAELRSPSPGGRGGQGVRTPEGKGGQGVRAERLLVSEGGKSFFVRTADIEWLEAARNYVRLHIGPRVCLVRTTLSALEAQLDAERFRRVGRSALVNVDRIKEIQPWFHGDALVILQSGEQVTLSRRYRMNILSVPSARPL
jgi:LytTr DNA-binding domain